MQELLAKLGNFAKIIVTGPQRAGTTIGTKILAAELGYEFIQEEAFQVHRLDLLCLIALTKSRFVLQAPTMSGCCHYLTGVAVVFMRRPIADIVKSEQRVHWNSQGFEKAKYFDSSRRLAAEVKYDAWDRFQKRLLKDRAFELEYASLHGHPLWVPAEQRQHFSVRQLELSGNGGAEPAA